jgi:sugar lactone lactonase YvrE
VAVGPDGAAIVADTENHRIRRIGLDGVVTTVAGDGQIGLVDGAAATARFAYPRAVAVDQEGYIYVGDTNNHCVRKIAPDGEVTTLAGNGQQGTADGARGQARFAYPNGIALDPAGICYVADSHHALIRKISRGGTVSTLAGNGIRGYADGPGKLARFGIVHGLAVTRDGVIYLAEFGNSRVRRIEPDGEVSTFLGDGRGGYAEGVGTSARLFDPLGVAVDAAGNLIVCDSSNQCVRRFTPDGVGEVLAGNPGGAADFADGTGTEARFSLPWGVAVGPDGSIYVADCHNHAIRRIRMGT